MLQELENQERVDEPKEPTLKKRKFTDMKTEDADAKFAFHPTGTKFVNTWLWNHFKLSRRHEKWALCVLCEKAQVIMWALVK